MDEKIRLVGGASAGDTIQWDRRIGPIISIPKHPDFASCWECNPGQAADVQPIHIEEYQIQEVHYGSGHQHLLAAPVHYNMRLVDIINMLWHSYQDSNKKALDE